MSEKPENKNGSGSEEFGSGSSPQNLNQLQATGAGVLGSDGEKIGDLGEVRDADFSVRRSALRRNLDIPVTRVQRVNDAGNIVLDVSSEEVGEMGWESDFLSGRTDPTADFSSNPEVEKGTFGIKHEETD